MFDPTQKSEENTECPIQDFIDFAIKLFYKFLIIISYFHKILYDSDIPIDLNDLEYKQWKKISKISGFLLNI